MSARVLLPYHPRPTGGHKAIVITSTRGWISLFSQWLSQQPFGFGAEHNEHNETVDTGTRQWTIDSNRFDSQAVAEDRSDQIIVLFSKKTWIFFLITFFPPVLLFTLIVFKKTRKAKIQTQICLLATLSRSHHRPRSSCDAGDVRAADIRCVVIRILSLNPGPLTAARGC